jgi:hypothetical protein
MLHIHGGGEGIQPVPKLPIARPGEKLEISHQPVEFSFWPVGKTTRRYGLQTRIFTSDPWAVIAEGIAAKFAKKSRQNLREAAIAFNAQAEDFYEASQASRLPYAKPLLIYYSFLNLVKAFILMAGRAPADYRPRHGMAENANLRQVEGATVTVYRASAKKRQLFDDFHLALTGSQLKQEKKKLRLGHLMPQILFGHRLWCTAAKEPERFITISDIAFLRHKVNKQVWLRMRIRREELARADVTQHDLLQRSGLKDGWQCVHVDECDDLCIEQTNARTYKDRPSDQMLSVTRGLANRFWSSVLLHPPYRKYYLYAPPPDERPSVLPQLLSMFVVMFFLGSITRYRPHHFERLLDTQYGAHLLGATNEVPMQFIYLLASEMLNREVTKASIA